MPPTNNTYAAGDAVASADGVDARLRDRRERLRLDTVMHDVHASLVHRERVEEIPRRRGGRHDDRRRDREGRREPPAPPLVDVRRGLGEVPEREIVTIGTTRSGWLVAGPGSSSPRTGRNR
jgi:hypothetical protein